MKVSSGSLYTLGAFLSGVLYIDADVHVRIERSTTLLQGWSADRVNMQASYLYSSVGIGTLCHGFMKNWAKGDKKKQVLI
jgi:hypothetical protein